MTKAPWKRENGDPTMRLPDDKTCADCAHCERCCAMFGHIPADEVCDFSPTRFRQRQAAAPAAA